MMTLHEILDVLRSLAPETSALPGDPVGLLIGTEDSRPIHKIGICLDATPQACERAVQEKVELMVAHHPLIYRPLQRLDPVRDPIARAALCLAHANIAFYAMHTNWDKAPDGINDTLAMVLELTEVQPLGKEGLDALPRIGLLPAPRPLADFARFVERTLACGDTSALRCQAPAGQTMVSRVAVCGGAGAELLQAVRDARADAYVTSDVRHHEFLAASGIGLALLDAGHAATETPGMRALLQSLTKILPAIESVWVGA